MNGQFAPGPMRRAGRLLGTVAGLWGNVVILVFVLSQIRMLSPGTPWAVVREAYGQGFLFLAAHWLAFTFGIAVSAPAIVGRRPRRRREWGLVLLSVILVAVSLIPTSTIGGFVLPGTLGMLLGGVVLVASGARYRPSSPG